MIAQSILSKIAKAALGFANFGAGSASTLTRYQPKLPASLKKKIKEHDKAEVLYASALSSLSFKHFPS